MKNVMQIEISMNLGRIRLASRSDEPPNSRRPVPNHDHISDITMAYNNCITPTKAVVQLDYQSQG